ncbi:hypothetical protein H5T51_04150 [Candidatus Bathyarchaeota archaeon]|nr:hypothetical protein [Candidatus Bathyarchaeota archaeon]
MTKSKILSLLFITSLLISLYLSYENYLLQRTNKQLISDIKNLSESYQNLEDMHFKLKEAYLSLEERLTLLNQTLRNLEQNYSALLTEHLELLQNHTLLNDEYQRVLSNYVELTVTYEALNITYHELLENYTLAEQKAAQYDRLINDYELLSGNYTQLKKDYELFFRVLYEPLSSENKTAPTINELKQWLAVDETDKLEYAVPDFVCGDYAVMLHMHAKMKGWDMGIVAVIGKIGGEDFNHAFNAIKCKEGLVYVEPQNDEVFYGPIDSGLMYYHPGFGWVRVEEFIVVVLYDLESNEL